MLLIFFCIVVQFVQFVNLFTVPIQIGVFSVLCINLYDNNNNKIQMCVHVYHTTSTYTHICYSYPAGTTISPSRTSLLPSGGQLDLQTGQFKCPLTNQVVKHSA